VYKARKPHLIYSSTCLTHVSVDGSTLRMHAFYVWLNISTSTYLILMRCLFLYLDTSYTHIYMHSFAHEEHDRSWVPWPCLRAWDFPESKLGNTLQLKQPLSRRPHTYCQASSKDPLVSKAHYYHVIHLFPFAKQVWTRSNMLDYWFSTEFERTGQRQLFGSTMIQTPT
jgi:hypothetical protein